MNCKKRVKVIEMQQQYLFSLDIIIQLIDSLGLFLHFGSASSLSRDILHVFFRSRCVRRRPGRAAADILEEGEARVGVSPGVREECR